MSTSRPPGTQGLKARLLRLATDSRVFLLLVALAYCLGYLGHPAAPGNSPPYPLGWWGWYDQSHYLESVKGFAEFDLAPGRHSAPPLYFVLGAFFHGVNPMHPFWLIDLVCLLWFAWSFVAFARRYVPAWMPPLIFILIVVANRVVFENFLIPWTTTLSIALLSIGLNLLPRLSAKDGEAPGAGAIALGSLALGLIAIVRPLDTVVAGVVWLGMWIALLRSGANRRKLWLAPLTIAVGPLSYLLFNQLLFGSPFGGYIRVGAANGYFPADTAEKFVSLFLDGYTLYLEPGSGLLDHFPWFAVALPSVVFVLVRGDWALRTVAAALSTQFALYLPYGDLLPTGLWRYLNIHYFVWTLPYLALFVCHAGLSIVRGWRAAPASGHRWLAFTAATALLLASLRAEVGSEPVGLAPTGSERREFVMPLSGRETDLIDINGLHGSFPDVYFGAHELELDGRPLVLVREYRVLPAPWGVRILFIRPVQGQSVVFRPDPRLTASPQLLATRGSYHFSLGRPKPFWNEDSIIPAPLYPLGTLVEFSSAGTGDIYAHDGWSTPEGWGRWSTGKRASLRFKLEPPTMTVNVELVLTAYVPDDHHEQRVIVEANGSEVARLVFAASDSKDPRVERFTVPVAGGSQLDLVLHTPDTVSPAELGLSGDNRTLGVALVSVLIGP